MNDESLLDTDVMQYFEYDHLPLKMQAVSRPFCELAKKLRSELPVSFQLVMSLQKLLEAKDAAVRASK